MNKKKTLIIILSLISLCILVLTGFILMKIHNKSDITEVNKPVALDTIKDYDYTLEDRDTDLFKEKFDELKTVLSKKEIDYEAYAKLITELYIIDLYTINNKSSVYDVGALEYIYPSSCDNFAIKVKDTIYKYMQDNSDGKRTQKLPEVKGTNIDNIEESTFKVNDKEYDGFSVDISWEYKEDLGYDTSANIHIIKKDNKLFIVLQK